MTHASVFSGIGAPELAAAMLGWDNLFHCEINPFGRKVLQYWFPNSVSYEDITKTDFSEWRGKVDVLTGGFPCQPFSTAGKRKGADDDRYLWPFMHKAIQQIRPTWIVCENVGGIITMVEQGMPVKMATETTLFGESRDLFKGGGRFTIERICKEIEEEGYSVQPILIPAAGVGAPHKRNRVFFIANANGCFSGRNAGEVCGTEKKERLQERYNLSQSGNASEVRSTLPGTAENTMCMGSTIGENDQLANEQRQGNTCTTSNVRQTELFASDTSCERHTALHDGRNDDRRTRTEVDTEWQDEPLVGIGGYGTNETATDTDNGREDTQKGNATNSERIGRTTGRNDAGEFESSQQSKCGEQQLLGANGASIEGLLPENRFRTFPTVSPVYRGNDGIPFDVDDLTIPFTQWRKESLKAYGNAIVPQVMYEIFRAIELASKQ